MFRNTGCMNLRSVCRVICMYDKSQCTDDEVEVSFLCLDFEAKMSVLHWMCFLCSLSPSVAQHEPSQSSARGNTYCKWLQINLQRADEWSRWDVCCHQKDCPLHYSRIHILLKCFFLLNWLYSMQNCLNVISVTFCYKIGNIERPCLKLFNFFSSLIYCTNTVFMSTVHVSVTSALSCYF